jgi:NAD(P)H-dependent flavin oxidoreductase YrpB (nitropropane dioxygenase family)
MMTKATMVDGDARAGILPTGQVVGAIEDLPKVADLLERIMAEAEESLSRLAATE